MNVLVIPDAHAHPNHDNKRFDRLGEYVARKWPDIVVCIGDWADMSSICKHNSKLAMEGQRYELDVAAAIDAQTRFFAPIRARKKKLPRFVMCLGNHEDRIDRISHEDPQLQGVISIDDLAFEQFGWEVIPFKETFHLEEWCFSHYFASGVMGNPISGDMAARNLVKKNHESCVQGHSHLMGHFSETTARNRRLHGVSVGCYSHPDQVEGWNRNTVAKWWYGVVWLHNLKGSDASVAFVRAEDI